MTIQATDKQRRSFHYRALTKSGAVFTDLGDVTIPANFGDSDANELNAAKQMGLAELSTLPRGGIKGADTQAWLDENGYQVGEESNRAYLQTDGKLVAKLAPGEVLILPAMATLPEGDGGCEPQGYEDGRLCYPVPRRESNLWFRVTGEATAKMFAKICGVDLRHERFTNHAIAQTGMARINVIVIRDDIGETPAYHLLTDSASAAYIWGALLDAMDEFGGKPVGMDALQKLIASSSEPLLKEA